MSKIEEDPLVDEDVEMVKMSFSLPRPLYDKFTSTVPWGLRGHYIRAMMNLSLERMGREGSYEILGAIMAGEYDPCTTGEKDD